MEKGGKTSLNCTQELGSNNSAKEGNSDGDDWGDTYSSHSIQYHHEPNNPYNLSGVQPAVSDGAPDVRKSDLSHLCFSLNFYFLMFLRLFPSMFPLLTYSQSFIPLTC